MAFTRLSYVRSWLRSDEQTGFPTQETSESKVREDMQYHPDKIMEYINSRLLAELESVGGESALSGAEQIGDTFQGTVAATLARLFERADENHEDILALAGGGVPDVVKSSVVAFTADGWAESDGAYELRILQTQHKRPGGNFGYKLQSLFDGVLRTDTWAVLCTSVGYDSETQDIVLTAESAYDGVLTAFGV